MGGYLGTLLLFVIPVVGLILMLVWSFANDIKPERRKLARAYLLRAVLLYAIGIVVAVAVGTTLFAILGSMGGAGAMNGFYGN